MNIYLQSETSTNWGLMGDVSQKLSISRPVAFRFSFPVLNRASPGHSGPQYTLSKFHKNAAHWVAAWSIWAFPGTQASGFGGLANSCSLLIIVNIICRSEGQHSRPGNTWKQGLAASPTPRTGSFCEAKGDYCVQGKTITQCGGGSIHLDDQPQAKS